MTEQTVTTRTFEEGSLEYRLSKFNAKERFAVVQRILGVHFVPHAAFLKEVLGDGFVPEPEDVFCAMDFHLDWLYAALINKELVEGTAIPFESGAVTGKQQDVDFVLCFTDKANNETHLLLIEAKGYGSWDTEQIDSKFKQYRAMKEAFKVNPQVKPRFILMSRNNPFEHRTRQNENFLAAVNAFTDFDAPPVWIKLEMDAAFAVVRCREDSTPTKVDPTHYKFVRR